MSGNEPAQDATAVPDRYEEIALAFRVLSDPMRLRILGLLAREPTTGVDLAGEIGLSTATISHHLSRLQKAGLVVATPDGTSKRFALNAPFFDPITLLPGAESERRTGEPDADRERARTLRHFFDGRRLKTIPAKRKQLVIVIQELLGWFEPNRDYPEREVNEILREAHEDVATLRGRWSTTGTCTAPTGSTVWRRCFPNAAPRSARRSRGTSVSGWPGCSPQRRGRRSTPVDPDPDEMATAA